MERFHYLRDATLIGGSLRYGAELDGQRVALLSWGGTALRNADGMKGAIRRGHPTNPSAFPTRGPPSSLKKM